MFDAHVCKVTYKHLPKPLRSHTRSVKTQGQLFEICPFVCKVQGEEKVPTFFGGDGILIFYYVGQLAKFRNPRTTFLQRGLQDQ